MRTAPKYHTDYCADMDRWALVAVVVALALLASCTGTSNDPGVEDRDNVIRAETSAGRVAARPAGTKSWTGSVRRRVDDAEEAARGRMFRRSSDLELIRDRNRQRVGLRFTGVRVPRGAVIRRAWVQFSADRRSTRTTRLRIRAQASDSAQRFRDRRFDLRRRTHVAATVAWSPRRWTSAGALGGRQRTPNLRSVLQPVVNREGWRSGNAVALLFTGSGRRVAASYESSRKAPTLHIEYVPTRFTFAAAGDLGADRHTRTSLQVLDRSSAEFFLALGDMRYGELSSDAAWCDYVLDRLPNKGRRFPLELVTGNHEQTGSSDGNIAKLAECLPDRLDASRGGLSRYGAQYSIDYPKAKPLARFVMIAPNLRMGDTRYTYGPGSPHRSWLVRRIESARAAGIPWVIVGLHYPCLTVGATHGCDSGEEVLNLLVAKKVDLVLTGHNHIYERSKQLRLNGSTCPALHEDATDPDYITDDGQDDSYAKGRGTVQVTAGSFGRSLQGVDETDPDMPYFASVDEDTFGLMTYVVDRHRIRAKFLPSTGGFTDSFQIVSR